MKCSSLTPSNRTDVGPIAEVEFDLSDSDEKMWARVYAPERCQGSEDWACTFEIDAPIAVRRTIYGVSSMQALVLGLKTLAAYLYGSELYRNKQLGIYGEFGGNLSIPAPSEFLNDAPRARHFLRRVDLTLARAPSHAVMGGVPQPSRGEGPRRGGASAPDPLPGFAEAA